MIARYRAETVSSVRVHQRTAVPAHSTLIRGGRQLAIMLVVWLLAQKNEHPGVLPHLAGTLRKQREE